MSNCKTFLILPRLSTSWKSTLISSRTFLTLLSKLLAMVTRFQMKISSSSLLSKCPIGSGSILPTLRRSYEDTLERDRLSHIQIMSSFSPSMALILSSLALKILRLLDTASSSMLTTSATPLILSTAVTTLSHS